MKPFERVLCLVFVVCMIVAVRWATTMYYVNNLDLQWQVCVCFVVVGHKPSNRRVMQLQPLPPAPSYMMSHKGCGCDGRLQKHWETDRLTN